MRTAHVHRKTAETDITIDLTLDGTGSGSIHSGIAFLDHMLSSFTRHGRFNLDLAASGDLEVGLHHTVEDIGILLGEAFREALGDGKGIRRFSHAIIPMDESQATIAVDTGGRSYLEYHVSFTGPIEGVLDPGLVEHFFESLVQHARITLHIEGKGRSDHHLCEAIFKAAGIALGQAVTIIHEDGEIPSTKGTL